MRNGCGQRLDPAGRPSDCSLAMPSSRVPPAGFGSGWRDLQSAVARAAVRMHLLESSEKWQV